MKTNKTKITKEFCRDKILLFYPKTEEDADFIQRKFFNMGFRWSTGSTDTGYFAECVDKGMVLKAPKLYTGPNSESKGSGLLCTSTQFDKADAPDLTPEEQASLREDFNALAAVVREMAKKVNAIYEQVMPKSLDKPALKKPENDSP